ncbi:glycosyltransferase family protein [Endozoicomonas acroporae]|uniref:glycosyltransferase family protein n=1 Tax=Endozoicomonas acroporae TaxID=1701104 RepID=UPI0013D7E71B|nr:glycosyltransferase family protein [Endozoicomonas acroporae]
MNTLAINALRPEFDSYQNNEIQSNAAKLWNRLCRAYSPRYQHIKTVLTDNLVEYFNQHLTADYLPVNRLVFHVSDDTLKTFLSHYDAIEQRRSGFPDYLFGNNSPESDYEEAIRQLYDGEEQPTEVKILFGIQGMGNGHLTRSRLLAKALADRGAKVQYLVSGRQKNTLNDMEVFGDYLHRNGFAFISENGHLNFFQTLIHFMHDSFGFIRDVWTLNVKDYDLIISDFEPVTAWAGYLANKAVVGFGHQYSFDFDVPILQRFSISRLAVKLFAPATETIGLHWVNFNNQPILPPIIDTTMQPCPDKNHLVVYLPFENQDNVAHLLNNFSGYRFKIYGPRAPEVIGNAEFFQMSVKGFKESLQSSRGVICNCGFTLIAECMHIGLPILTKPLKGQIEQLSNAYTLENRHLAEVFYCLNYENLKPFIETAQRKEANPYPNVADAFAGWVVSGRRETVAELSEKLWQSQRAKRTL